MATGPIIGVDVGGTKVAAARIADGRPHDACELPTSRASSDDIVDEIERAIRNVTDRCGEPCAVGVGIPSQVDAASGRILSSVNIPLKGVALGDELERRFGVPVRVDNDGNCAALAEAAAQDPPASELVMYTLGTGVGGGIVIGGHVYHGATGLGGELGHVVVQADGPDCPGDCPNNGCLEALCSGTALERDALALAEGRPDSALAQVKREHSRIRGRDVVALARDGDGDARDLLDALGRWLGVGLANAVNQFEPQLVAIGGGLVAGADFFFERARSEARRRALPALAERVAIELAVTGPEAGVVGAGLLAAQHARGEQ